MRLPLVCLTARLTCAALLAWPLVASGQADPAAAWAASGTAAAARPQPAAHPAPPAPPAAARPITPSAPVAGRSAVAGVPSGQVLPVVDAAHPVAPAAPVAVTPAAAKVVAVPVRVAPESRVDTPVATAAQGSPLVPTEEGGFWHQVVRELVAAEAVTALVRELALQSQLIARDAGERFRPADAAVGGLDDPLLAQAVAALAYAAFGELFAEGRLDPDEAVLVQLAIPSRERVDQYRILRNDIDRLVGHINGGHTSLPERDVCDLCAQSPRAIEIVPFAVDGIAAGD